jgi:tetratricopeptide (TPR) repeat protein
MPWQNAAMPCPREEQLLAWVGGQLDTDASSTLLVHVDRCAVCRRTVVELQRERRAAGSSRTDERLRPGDRLGRYVITNVLGAGAMGIVFAARDPALERQVALKVLRPELAASSLRARLLREAQSLARLAHPHVVRVYDLGEADGRLFVAMELVEGRTLRGWLADAQRRPREIVELFLQAGRGLAAAHAAGLVHRDFKPDNVLVSRDGRAQVSDFGLVGTGAADGAAGLPDGAPPLQSVALVGTPAYMAPEQARGEPVDARADQFAFCVALCEALTGERPFSGASAEAIAQEASEGRIREGPLGRLDGRVKALIVRGLSPDRAARFPSMDALLDALDPAPRERQRRRLQAGLASLVALGAGVGLWAASHRGPGCADLATAAIDPTWNASTRARLEQEFVAAAPSFGRATVERVVRLLDERAAAWIDMRRAACEATVVRRAQSTELLDLRLECLDDEWREVKELIATLQTADAAVVQRAVQAVSALDPLDRCADAKQLRQLTAPRRSPAEEQQLSTVKEQIARARALEHVGHPREAIPIARVAVEAAERAGDAATRAEALYALGLVEDESDQLDAAKATLIRAAAAAEAGARDDIVARTFSYLIGNVGYKQHDLASSSLFSQLAEGAIQRLGGNDQLEGFRLSNEGSVFLAHGRFEDALSRFQDALTRRERAEGPGSIGVAEELGGIVATLVRLKRCDEALKEQEQARVIYERAFGVVHPSAVEILLNRSAILLCLERPADALTAAHQGRLRAEQVYGTHHKIYADTLVNEADSLGSLHRWQEAIPLLLEARPIVLARDPRAAAVEDHDVLELLGQAYLRTHQPADALRLLDRFADDRDRDPKDAYLRFLYAWALYDARPAERKHALARAAAASAELTRAQADGGDQAADWLKQHQQH